MQNIWNHYINILKLDICKIYYCEVDVTDIMHHENIKDMEDLIVDEFAEDFYYLSKPC